MSESTLHLGRIEVHRVQRTQHVSYDPPTWIKVGAPEWWITFDGVRREVPPNLVDQLLALMKAEPVPVDDPRLVAFFEALPDPRGGRGVATPEVGPDGRFPSTDDKSRADGP